MRLSKLIGERIKDVPANVSAKSHKYLLRAGYIKQVCNGVYSLLPPALRVQKKICQIIREEMDKVDGQEVLFPVLMPRELWEESGRYSSIGNEMFRFKDRTGHDMVLGMTHEEAAVHMAKNTVKSYDQLPFMIYQIQTKLRDEPRARAGLIRVKEFTMKDAYSFHETQEDLEKYYQKMYVAYHNIFTKIGMKNYIAVQSDGGMMGGNKTHEFMLITDIGEDSLVMCENGDYQANQEVATAILPKYPSTEEQVKEINTGNMHTIEEITKFFNIKNYQTCKAVVYYGVKTHKYYLVFIRGDLQVNIVKLRNLVKEEVVMTDDIKETNLVKGYIGPKDFSNDNLTVLYDVSLKGEKNLVVGGNKQGIHKTGFSFERDVKNVEYTDLYQVEEGYICPVCHGKLKINRGVEIGQIFQLGTKYTKSMKMTVHSKEGKDINPIMGCYGIGIGRALACVAEENSDEKGLIWPVSIAPWQIYIASLKMSDENIKNQSEELYKTLTNANFEVLFDDRNVSAGVKFADSELMGIPVRIVVSKRNLENNQYEISNRATGEKLLVDKDEIVQKLHEILNV